MTSARPTLGVSACLLQDGRVLLVKRGRPPFAGLYSLPGGRVEFGERLEAAIAREITEETGIEPGGLVFHHLHEAIDAEAAVHAVIAVFRSTTDLPDDCEPVAGDDAAEVIFVSLDELEALAAQGRTTPGLTPIVRAAAAS